MISSRFLKPVAYIQRPACSRPFFSLPSFPAFHFGSSNNKDDDWRRKASGRDEDEPEENEDEVQRYHERKILPCVAIRAGPSQLHCTHTSFLIDIVRRSCTIW